MACHADAILDITDDADPNWESSKVLMRCQRTKQEETQQTSPVGLAPPAWHVLKLPSSFTLSEVSSEYQSCISVYNNLHDYHIFNRFLFNTHTHTHKEEEEKEEEEF